MTRWISFSLVAVAALGFLALFSPQNPAQVEAAKDKPYKMVADLHVVMEFADEVFYNIPDKIKDGKVRKIRGDAMIIAELMNVSHYSEDYAKEDGWGDAINSSIEQLVELSKAAKANDKDAVSSLHKKVEASCDSCHEKFRD